MNTDRTQLNYENSSVKEAFQSNAITASDDGGKKGGMADMKSQKGNKGGKTNKFGKSTKADKKTNFGRQKDSKKTELKTGLQKALPYIIIVIIIIAIVWGFIAYKGMSMVAENPEMLAA